MAKNNRLSNAIVRQPYDEARICGVFLRRSKICAIFCCELKNGIRKFFSYGCLEKPARNAPRIVGTAFVRVSVTMALKRLPKVGYWTTWVLAHLRYLCGESNNWDTMNCMTPYRSRTLTLISPTR